MAEKLHFRIFLNDYCESDRDSLPVGGLTRRYAKFLQVSDQNTIIGF